MLALIGHEDDAVCDALKRFADRIGFPAVRVRDPAAWTVTIDLAEHTRVTLSGPDRSLVHCAVNRGLPQSAGLSAAQENDLMAAWWAALALLPGPVANRPGRQGFLPAPDVGWGTLTTRPRAGGTANAHDAYTGRFLYRTHGEHPAAGVPVVHLTPLAPEQTWRLMIAGDRAVEIAAPASGGLTARDRASCTRVLRRMKAAGLAFALVVLSRDQDGPLKVIAVNPLPSLSHYEGHEDEVHTALMQWVTR